MCVCVRHLPRGMTSAVIRAHVWCSEHVKKERLVHLGIKKGFLEEGAFGLLKDEQNPDK